MQGTTAHAFLNTEGQEQLRWWAALTPFWKQNGKPRLTASGDVEVLDDAHGLILGHQLARDVFIFPLHHAGNAEEIDQHPEAETANREPVDQLHADAAEVEIVETEEEPEEVGEERGFFADFIVAQHARIAY